MPSPNKEITFDVLRDTREQQGWSFSRSKAVLSITDTKLDTGDYTIAGMEKQLCIERKATTSEIANNICQKRFFAELERMLVIPHRFIICEFLFKDVLDFPKNSGIPDRQVKYLKITSQFMLKSLSEIEVKYGVSVIYAGNPQSAEIIADNLMRRVYEKYN